jgi:hypothetical protein
MQSIRILKLVQKVIFLLVFQSMYLQNLENFGQIDGHQFEFQNLGDSKALKLRNRVGPTCQWLSPPPGPACQRPRDKSCTTHRPIARSRAPLKALAFRPLRSEAAIAVPLVSVVTLLHAGHHHSSPRRLCSP